MLKYITDKFEKLILNQTDFNTNKVDYNNQLVSFAELPKLIRKEKNIPNNEDICIKVYTCYGGNMPYYVVSHNLVVSAFANMKELFFKPNANSFEFSYG